MFFLIFGMYLYIKYFFLNFHWESPYINSNQIDKEYIFQYKNYEYIFSFLQRMDQIEIEFI